MKLRFRSVFFMISTMFLFTNSSVWAQQYTTVYVPPPPNFSIKDLGLLISSLFGAILVISGLLSFFQLLVSGLQWIVSGGDKAALEAARNKLIHAILGLVIVFSAWALMLLIQQFLGVTILGPISIQRPLR